MSTVSKLLSRSSFVGPKIPLLILQGNSLSMLVGSMCPQGGRTICVLGDKRGGIATSNVYCHMVLSSQKGKHCKTEVRFLFPTCK